jgi:hypothetical protein
MMLTARYSASATTTLANACGNVSADSDQRSSARASISGARPSVPPNAERNVAPFLRAALQKLRELFARQRAPVDLQRDDVAAAGSADTMRSPSRAIACCGSAAARWPSAISFSSRR